jgi:primosomal protein N' (replication factor Y)
LSELLFHNESTTEYITYFAEVMLPIPIPQLFTYRVPVHFNEYICVGARVVIQFGAKRVVTGVVVSLHQNPPLKYEAKYILELLDEKPIVNQLQFKFFDWISKYYICHQGEVLNAALPSGLKLSSESRVQLNPEFDLETANLNVKELQVVEELKEKEALTYNEIELLIGQKNIYPLIKSLLDKKAILLFELLKEKYKPKYEQRIRLHQSYTSNEQLNALLNNLAKKESQLNVLMRYLQKVRIGEDEGANQEGILKKELTEVSDSSVATLIKNGILEQFEIITSRLESFEHEYHDFDMTLSEAQARCKTEILNSFSKQDVCLLHGITGSGKTEVYIDLIKNVLDNGDQVLMLLPEIALTTQIVSRLRKVFGDSMGVYHSKFPDNERVEIWNGLLEGKFSFIVGVRSSVLLPFSNLGLIIIDEEHETSYKQYDPAPRYHAREAAIMLAHLHHSKVLLGSATPSVESYYLAINGKWGFTELTQRYGNSQLPNIELVNTKTEKQAKTMKNDFSSTLLQALVDNKKNGMQSILFQNRRGYAPYIVCEECQTIPHCKSCDVSLTYHMRSNELRCHYCGYHEPMSAACTSCNSSKLKTQGLGTERIEDELKLMIPDLRVQRMDLDTTRSKHGYQKIINDFEQENIDVLVGTQMVTKGLDFDKVSLVGIFDADRMLHFPDFRSNERTFHMLTQVSGRAGRRGNQGTVLIQTSNPSQKILQLIQAGDYIQFYNDEIKERANFLYPPFVRLIKIVVKSDDKNLTFKVATELKDLLLQSFGKGRVLGPEAPIIERIRDVFYQELLMKIERQGVDLNKAKQAIKDASAHMLQKQQFKKVRIEFDVDPN